MGSRSTESASAFFYNGSGSQRGMKKWDRRIRKEGEDVLAISQQLRILAAKGAKSLESFEKSIWDVTEFFEPSNVRPTLLIFAADDPRRKIRSRCRNEVRWDRLPE
jgi:hypothetical protein